MTAPIGPEEPAGVEAPTAPTPETAVLPPSATIDVTAGAGRKAEGDNLRGATVAGVGWSGLAQVATQAVQLLSSLAITRLLLPRDFGLSGEVLVFFGLATLLADFGLFQALIQKKDLEARHLTAAFWAQAGLGLAATAITFACAPLVASFYDEPRLRVIAMGIAPGFLLSSLGTVPQAILARGFKFKQLSVSRVITAVVASGVAVVLAALGAGVWALVALNLLTAGVSTVVAWFFARWRPAGRFVAAALRELLGFSSRIFGFNLMNYGTQNLDNLLVGRVLGATPLGLYVRAFTFVLVPARQVSTMLGQVMFTSLSRVGDDKERTKRIYLRTLSVIAVLAFPVMVGLATVCDEFVRTAFGPRWIGAIVVMRLFCLVGAMAPLITTVGWIYQAQGRADLLLKWGIVAGSVYMGSVVVGIIVGSLTSVAVAILINYLILLYPCFAIPGRLIGMSFRDFLRAMQGTTAATVLMVVAVLGVNQLLGTRLGPPPRLAIETAVGAVAYGASVHFGRVAAYRDLLDVVGEQLRRRRGQRAAASA